MNINEINPHIRFARELNYCPASYTLCASDYHFYYTLSECEILIDDNLYTLNEDTTIIIPAGVPYCLKSSGRLRIISINFDYTQNHSSVTKEKIPVNADNFSDSDICELVSIDDCPILNKPLIKENTDHHLKDIKIILEEFSYRKQLFREICSGHLKNIIVKLSREIQAEETSGQGINKILNYIHNHYSQDIKNDILAEVCGYHSYHLNRLMKKATGTTLHQYLINYRIEAAKQYLRETDFPILNIAELCGYKNFSNFSHDFKNKTGFTPSSYRTKFKHLM